jgi:zinc D-Ala-D-Ala carboxypeptidase
MPDPVLTFRHFREVPQHFWRWPNFSPAEIACRGTGQLKLHPLALDKLHALRDRLGKPLVVRSAYRSPEHNRNVGGAPASKHMDGTAFDIAMTNHDPAAFEAAAREALAQSRTLKGTGAAGVATVGAAGVEVAQEVLAEAQGAVLPLVPYLDTLRWLFIALALGGIAVAIWARVDDWRRGLR